MDMKALVQRIDQRLEELGLTAAEVSRRATGSADTIRNWKRAAEKGGSGGATVTKLEPVARVLSTPVSWLMGGDGEESVDEVSGPVSISQVSVSFGGKVGAGGFLPVSEYFDQDDEHLLIPQTVVPHPQFPGIRQFAWVVEGDSMDRSGIFTGMWVVAAPYIDYIDKIGDLQNGQIVIVERTRFGGSEAERTLKEVQFARGGIRLVPRSSNPKYKEFFLAIDPLADGDEIEIKVLAVVLAATIDFVSKR